MEGAVAQSARSFYSLSAGGQLPFSNEVLDLIDDLSAERLPAHLLERGREQREEQAAHRREVAEHREWVAGQLDALEGMDPAQRDQVAAEATQRFGEYSNHVWQLKHRIRELDAAQKADPSTGASEDARAGEEAAEA
jgi:FKBP-type peptidyl-prolyl cis-trans isomerase 2